MEKSISTNKNKLIIKDENYPFENSYSSKFFNSKWKNYTNNLIETIQIFKENGNISNLADLIWDNFDGLNEIHVLGNGGSAANAHHIVGDFTKTFCLYKQNLKISSVSDNGCYLTAASNDIDFSEVYSFLIPHRIKPNDLVIFLSGSGNSSNLVKCALKAKDHKIKTASITGYNGGRLANLSDLSINFKIDDMEIAEDLQLIVFHFIKQYLCERLVSEKNIEPFETQKYNKRISVDEVA